MLVAIKPFKKVHIYENDPVAAYKGKNSNSPHVYAIADSAFSKMMKGKYIIFGGHVVSLCFGHWL